jgi:hypothetical protein
MNENDSSHAQENSGTIRGRGVLKTDPLYLDSEN